MEGEGKKYIQCRILKKRRKWSSPLFLLGSSWMYIPLCWIIAEINGLEKNLVGFEFWEWFSGEFESTVGSREIHMFIWFLSKKPAASFSGCHYCRVKNKCETLGPESAEKKCLIALRDCRSMREFSLSRNYVEISYQVFLFNCMNT
jgi:hypothetical protein